MGATRINETTNQNCLSVELIKKNPASFFRTVYIARLFTAARSEELEDRVVVASFRPVNSDGSLLHMKIIWNRDIFRPIQHVSGHVTRIGVWEMEDAIDCRIILKPILMKFGWKVWTIFKWLRIATDEPSHSVKMQNSWPAELLSVCKQGLSWT
jgi:hypothetical protein